MSIAIDGVIYKAAGSLTIARQANQKNINLTAELERATVGNLVTGELYYWFDYSTQRELKALQANEEYTDGGVSVPEVFQLAGQPVARKKSIVVPLNFAKVNVTDGSLVWFTNDDGSLKVYERTVKLIADRARAYHPSIALLRGLRFSLRPCKAMSLMSSIVPPPGARCALNPSDTLLDYCNPCAAS